MILYVVLVHGPARSHTVRVRNAVSARTPGSAEQVAGDQLSLLTTLQFLMEKPKKGQPPPCQDDSDGGFPSPQIHERERPFSLRKHAYSTAKAWAMTDLIPLYSQKGNSKYN